MRVRVGGGAGARSRARACVCVISKKEMDDMDGKQVQERLTLIRSSMPETYRAIQERSALVGGAAFRLVRLGLRGQANCFWACEGGHVVGTPFSDHEIQRDIAQLMVQFGSTFVCVWGREAVPVVEGAHGAH